MPIPGGVLVAEGAARCLYSAAGMLRFLARLSGRRRHVRRSAAPGTEAPVVGIEQPSSLCTSSGLYQPESSHLDPTRAPDQLRDDVRLPQSYLRCRKYVQESRHQVHNDSAWSDSLEQSKTSPDHALSRLTGLCEASTTSTNSSATHWSGTERVDHQLRSSRTPLDRKTRSTESTGVARFRRRSRIPSFLVTTLLLLSYTLIGITDACSARSTPKPRPPSPTPRPNITYHMYPCSSAYAEFYCLNGATCFTVKIQESLLYNCVCANGFIGQRCEFKDLDGSYLPSRQRLMLETASIAGGATIAVFLVVIICVAVYIHCKRKQKQLSSSSTCVDTVDGPGRDPELRPFSSRNRSLIMFMAKNSQLSPSICPPLERKRMPGWNDYSQMELTRLASINEAKRSCH